MLKGLLTEKTTRAFLPGRWLYSNTIGSRTLGTFVTEFVNGSFSKRGATAH